MGKMQKLKKGFTLVELSIVIAVIAILIAVLVPTFVSLINSANESKDSQLAKNMNTTLTTYGAINGNPETPHEALEALQADGYLLKNMTPTSDGYSYIWDEDNNSVALLSDEFEVIYSNNTLDFENGNLWAIVSTQSQINSFKSSGYSFKYCIVATEEVEVDNSFDSCYAGDANVKLTNTTCAVGTEYTIYTDGGEITINTPNATVQHHGDASLVTVTAVYTASYHIYDEVKMAVLTKGHLVVEEGANVSILAITTTDTSSYKITTEESVTTAIGTIYVSASSYSATATVTVNGSDADAIASTSITDDEGNVTISDITYVSTTSQLEEFISSGTGMCVLKSDITISSKIYLDSGNFMMIDLNSYTLTSTHTSEGALGTQTSERNRVTNSSELTISNGTLKYNQITGSNTSLTNPGREKGVFIIESSSKMTLNNVNVITNGAFLFPKGDAAEVNVINSTITTSGSYCVATNSSTAANYGVNINLQNSTFETTESNAYDCPVMINVGGTLTIDSCYIYGQRQGVAVRAGTATITNTTISCNIKTSNIKGTSEESYMLLEFTNGTQSWGSSPQTALGAVVVGSDGADGTGNGYQANAIVTLDNCKLSYVITSDTEDETDYSAYAIGLYLIRKTSTTYKTEVTLTNNTTITGYVINISDGKSSSTLNDYTGDVQIAWDSTNSKWSTTATEEAE